ncbi:uncharacterized protein BO96DRAFT_435128 [Aspergillus niger CBS 101883]|uniref:uncharacterized protein n=1 Tax=Aspergillus lacticoffeatus (strain CBS 101883) TaxID=1450533 RepID=UPI000D8053EC|nr:uncharacterized protein BO96DRAFT_435128 [Aspergillus niger CBS 101883]PYH55738.1 hypothetical protein BO96DRAFT_435128 [Aspergillus niger CBS 101883]
MQDAMIKGNENDWLGLELSFPGGTLWKVTTKIRECEDLYSQKDHEEGGIVSEARAVYVASKVAGQAPPTAVLKIHMQVPWWGSATKRSSIRAQQAVAEPSARGENEVEALRLLTEAGCSSTPALIDWMNSKQTQDQWIPGGYIHFIVMEMVPGVDVCSIIDDMDRGERDELRAAFKQSWLLDLIEPFKQGMHFLWVDKSRPWSKEPSVGCGKEKVLYNRLGEALCSRGGR